MKKSDLKTGMFAELRNGKFYLVLEMPEGPVLANVNKITYTDTIHDDLTGWESDMDIIAVYERYGHTINDLLKVNLTNRKLIWRREEPKEMTVEEIQEALGYKVKIIESK
jgi:hypothetical protein